MKQINIKTVKTKANIANKVNFAFRIHADMFGTLCEGKRSFSVLKRVKKNTLQGRLPKSGPYGPKHTFWTAATLARQTCPIGLFVVAPLHNRF